MPFVFIHGVRQRNPEGLERLRLQLAQMMDRVAEEVPCARSMSVIAPYWGGLSVHPTLKGLNPATASRASYESGEGPDAMAVVRDACGDDRDLLIALLWRNAGPMSPLEQAEFNALLERDDLDAVWAEALVSWGAQEPEYEAATRPTPVLLKRKMLQRFADTVQKAATRMALHFEDVRTWVDQAHTNFALFVGDAMSYAMQRERDGVNAPILRRILSALPEHQDAEPLVVMTHSMGASIFHDVLTCYRPDLRVACWLSVASQVAQFKNLGLLKRCEPDPTLAARLHRWHNIFDPCDMLCFLAKPAFSEVEDVPYRTSRGPLGNHSWYFRERAFYELAGGLITDALRTWRPTPSS